MIDSIHIRNFQCHKKAELQLSPGVNVIVGTSDSGKSAILKALFWVLTNRPQGMAFRNFTCKKGDVMQVQVKTNGHTIIRSRSESENSYTVDDQKFVALRSDVPAEVTDAHGLTTINVQQQFQPHFLLSATPKEIIRTLNEVCDLSIIDRTSKVANSIHTDAKRSVAATEVALCDLAERQEKLQWSVDARKKIHSIKKIWDGVKADVETATSLKKLLEEKRAMDAAIDAAQEIRSLFRPLESMERQAGKLAAQKETCEDLAHIVSSLKETERKAQVAAKGASFVRELEALEAEYTTLQVLRETITNIHKCIYAVKSNEDSIQTAKKKVAITTKALDDLWKECDVCPLCETPLKRK